ncbi:MAG: FHA domain-containing protein [Armatimonadota bacterium]
MLRSTLILFVVMAILMISAAVYAVPTAVINVPAEGDHYYWFTYTGIDGEQVTTAPRRFKDKTATIELPMVKDAVVKSDLYIFNAETGNEAIKTIPPKAAESTKFDIKSSDYDHIRRVEIGVKSAENDMKAAAAVIILNNGDFKQIQVIDPSSSGSAIFTDVPSGTAKITINYGAGKSSTQDLDLSLDRKSLVPFIAVPVVGDIETIESSEPAVDPDVKSTKRGNTNRESAPVPDNGMSMGTAFLGLVLLAGVGYGAYRILKNKGVAVKSLLQQAGINLPDDQPLNQGSQNPAPAQIVVDPTVCQFCGGKKDPVTGACACSIGNGAALSAGAASEPRLIANQGAYAGSIFTLGTGSTTIGRDESNTIALPADNTASRRHARIENTGGSFTLYDEGSSNGTFVNGVKVTDRPLRPGDEIQVGSTRFRFEL